MCGAQVATTMTLLIIAILTTYIVCGAQVATTMTLLTMAILTAYIVCGAQVAACHDTPMAAK